MIDLFLESAWKVLVAGLLLGAGLPAIFALGVRYSAAGVGETTATSAGARPAYRALGAVCFLVVVLAIVVGIMIVVAAGFGKMVSFEHVLPTLVPKA